MSLHLLIRLGGGSEALCRIGIHCTAPQVENDGIIASCLLHTHETLNYVSPHMFWVTIQRITPSDAAAGSNNHFGIHGNKMLARVHACEFLLAGKLEHVIRGSGRLAAPQSPWRTIDAAWPVKIPAPLGQITHAEIDAEASAKFSGAAGVAPQRSFLNQYGVLQLDGFDGSVAHVALADGDRSGLAILERAPAPAAAFKTLHDKALSGFWLYAAEHDRATQEPMMRRRNFIDDGRSERGEDRV